jgi:multidrug efflux pump subunit AcrA (membrane-fusion protein)
MVDRNGNRRDGTAGDDTPPARVPGQVGSIPAPVHGFGWKLWLVLKTLQARLRFVVLLAAIGGLIAYWDTLSAYYEKWTRPAGEAEAASPDTEYFCPMHPFIVRDKPGEKCPICHMDLAKRKKGTAQAEPLPPGTVSRVQLSPYRVVLAGVQTTEIQYRPLVKEITTFGSVEFNETKEAHIAARQKGRIDKLYVNFTGQMVAEGEKLAVLDIRYSPELTVTLEDLLRARQGGNREREESARKRLRLWDVGDEQIQEFLSTGKVNTKLTITSPLHGHVIKKYQREGNYVEEGAPLYDVADLDTVWIEAQVYEADQAFLKLQQPVTATTLSLPNQEFRGTVSFIYPHLDESTRTLRVRFEMPNPGHRLRPGMYATVKIQVQPAQVDALAKAPAGDAERQAERRQGRVLAVPESAVIDTGSMKIVYREAAPNTYEGVAVQMGPRMTAADQPLVYHPVLAGLKAGDRVVTNGSFLIDAETRLNPAAGSIYFGGNGGGKGGSSDVSVRPSTPEDDDTKEKKVGAELAKLSAEDRRAAELQKFCPVLPANRLGSMGVPVKVMIEGQSVFLCCGGCEDKAKANPKQTLQKVEELKKGKPGAPRLVPPAPRPPTASPETAEIRAALAKLGAEDRRLAEGQRLCPITGKPLGSMGMPAKLILKGQPVFLCCAGCEDQAKDDAERTLAKVKELKAQTPRP